MNGSKLEKLAWTTELFCLSKFKLESYFYMVMYICGWGPKLLPSCLKDLESPNTISSDLVSFRSRKLIADLILNHPLNHML